MTLRNQEVCQVQRKLKYSLWVLATLPANAPTYQMNCSSIESILTIPFRCRGIHITGSLLHTALPQFEVKLQLQRTTCPLSPSLYKQTPPQDCLEVRTFGLQTHVIRRLKGLRGQHHVNCAATHFTHAEQSCENQRDVLRRFVCSVCQLLSIWPTISRDRQKIVIY